MSFSIYKAGIATSNDTLSGDAGEAINANFATIADQLSSLPTFVVSNASSGKMLIGYDTSGHIVVSGLHTSVNSLPPFTTTVDAAGNFLAFDTNVSFTSGIAVTGAISGFTTLTPATVPTITGSRGGSTALANLLTQLATLGLIVDGTSA